MSAKPIMNRTGKHKRRGIGAVGIIIIVVIVVLVIATVGLIIGFFNLRNSVASSLDNIEKVGEREGKGSPSELVLSRDAIDALSCPDCVCKAPPCPSYLDLSPDAMEALRGSAGGEDVASEPSATCPDSLLGGGWTQFGKDVHGTSHANLPLDTVIGQHNVESLVEHCSVVVHPENLGTRKAGISATPSMVRGKAYVTTWSGYIAKLDLESCLVDKKVFIGEMLAGKHGRSASPNNVREASSNTPAHYQYFDFDTDTVVQGMTFGTPVNRNPFDTHYDATVVSVDRDLNYKWSTAVGPANNRWFYGASTTASQMINIKKKQACGGLSGSDGLTRGHPSVAGTPVEDWTSTMRGSAYCLNLADGALAWRVFTVPPNDGTDGPDHRKWTGCGVPGSGISYSERLGYTYFTSSSLFQYPENVEGCMAHDKAHPYDPAETPQRCRAIAEANEKQTHDKEWRIMADAIFAVDGKGNVAWHRAFNGIDALMSGCQGLGLQTDASIPQCPRRPGPGWEFSQGAVLVEAFEGSREKVCAIAKSGVATCLDSATGETVWIQNLGPGSTTGGGNPGNAIVRVEIDNKQFTLMIAVTSGHATRTGEDLAMSNEPIPTSSYLVNGDLVCNSGIVHAVDVETGHVVWQYVGRYARTGNRCPEPAPVFGQDNSTEKYKRHYEFFTAGPPRIAPRVGTWCDNAAGQSAEPSDFKHADGLTANGAHFPGPPTTTSDLVLQGDVDGIMHALDARSGNCARMMYCRSDVIDLDEPDTSSNRNRGGIYGGAAIDGEYVAFGCGHEQDDLFFDKKVHGNSLSVYKLPLAA